MEKIIPHKDQTTGLCLDTLKKEKQALVFCSSKRAAESQAEKISKELPNKHPELASEILKALPNPTKQCKRLASIINKGVAFHHAGLASKQRELVEDKFREGVIKIICSTPTLAAGLDLPAFRAIVRDNKRFGNRGMMPIPVLEYEQMSGRAGRPGHEDFGEAILVANNQDDAKLLTDRYIFGEVEDIFSKLAVEPVLRTYVLSLVSAGFITTTKELEDFFDTTFYAHQFGDKERLHATLHRMTELLRSWGFLEGQSQEGFFSAANLITNTELVATPMGKRISEMYIDPLTAHLFLKGIKKHAPTETKNEEQTFLILHLLCCSLEIRPLIRTKVSEHELIASLDAQYNFLMTEDEYYTILGDNYYDTIKTAYFISQWIEEVGEDVLLEKYGVRPGELTRKLQIFDWLCYAAEEIVRIDNKKELIKIIKHLRIRIKHGAKSELIPLLQFKGIGRVRARKLYNNKITGVRDIVSADEQRLAGLVGPSIAKKLKEQV